MPASESNATDLIQKARRDRDPSLALLAAEKFAESGDLAQSSECLLFLGELRFSAGAIKEAATLFLKCRDSFRELNLLKGEAHSALKLSRCSAILRNDKDLSSERKYLEDALSLVQDAGEIALEIE
jgi:hypothetical protein